MTRRMLIAVIAAAGGCNGSGGGDGVPDGSAAGCEPRAFGTIGGPCGDDTDCGANGFCIDEEEELPAAGYCVAECSTDADCGPGAFCADVSAPPGGGGPPPKLCFPRCCDGAACPDGELCQDRLLGVFALGAPTCLPGNPAGADGDPCATAGDCNVESACWPAPEMPGGYCVTYDCTLGDDTSCAPGGDGICVSTGPGSAAICVDRCNMGSDCRESEGYQCRSIGFATVCLHPEIGEPCESDGDCGVSPWRCNTEAMGYPGGYCTIGGCAVGDPDACTEESTCHDPDPASSGDEHCVERCDPPGGECRPGYTCAATGGAWGCVPG